MKILLLSLLPTTENFGVKYLHASLLKEGHQSAIAFIPSHSPAVQKPLLDFIASFQPQLIGCGFMSYEAPFAAYLGKSVKESYPDIPFLVGGIHPTICPEECLEYADMVCIGEGEETVLELARALETGGGTAHINNLVLKDGREITKNPLRPLIDDLDRLPFPEHLPAHSHVFHGDKIHAMDMKLFRQYTRYDGKAYNMITSRGCPFSCAYCCNSFLSRLYGTKKIRKRSPGNVIAELCAVIKQFPDIILVNIHDDCFLAHSREWHEEFVRDYKKWVARPFIVRSTPLHLTEEKVQILKPAGLAWVTMGLQSGSERINREVYHRHVSNDKFLEATDIVRKHGISGYYDVILDNPFETEEDELQTLRVLRSVRKPFQLQLFTLTFYKGTEIFDLLQEKMGSADLGIRNYFNYRLTYLNKLVRISPLISGPMIDYFIQNRNNLFAKSVLAILYFFIVIFIEPVSYFHLMLKAFNYNLLLTLKIALPTFKTKIRERLMSFGFSSS
jgi:anaerobic magnesium-protoporphyrin IX monomethyl ester cyclase